MLKRPVVQMITLALTASGSWATRTPEAVAAQTADTGSTVQSRGWFFTLLDEQRQAELSGAATAMKTTDAGPEGNKSGLRVADRTGEIIPIAAINETGKMAFPPRDGMCQRLRDRSSGEVVSARRSPGARCSCPKGRSQGEE